MDIVKLKKRINEVFGKYKYACIVLLIGIILMMVPGKDYKSETVIQEMQTTETKEIDMEVRMEQILSCIEGAGQVKVMLSIAKGEASVYQTDSTYSQNDNATDTRTQTILVTDSSRNETGLIYQKNPPVYQGAIVLVQGADDANVRLAIVDAVMDVTGLGADRISVLKMQ